MKKWIRRQNKLKRLTLLSRLITERDRETVSEKGKNGPRDEDGVDGWRLLKETGFLRSLVASLAAFFGQATTTVTAVPNEAFEVTLANRTGSAVC